MSSIETPAPPAPTLLTCTRCGARFGCRPQGGCWCMELPHDVALPPPGDTAAGCLCPDCLGALRAAARKE